jgi:hypothetical protein
MSKEHKQPKPPKTKPKPQPDKAPPPWWGGNPVPPPDPGQPCVEAPKGYSGPLPPEGINDGSR